MSKAGTKKLKAARQQPSLPAKSQQPLSRPGALAAPAKKSTDRLWLSGILVLTFLAFSPSLFNEFVNWDDYAYIVDNPIIRSLSAENIQFIFNTNTFVVGNYHPLTVLSYALEYSLFKLDPLYYHLDNIILHLLNTVIVFFLTKRLTANQRVAIIMTMFFAIHPMRVESVTWAAERKDVLYTFFFLLSTWYYLSYVKSDGAFKPYAISIILFLCSILSKGQAVVLPLTLLLIDYYLGRRVDRKLIVEKIPYLTLSLIFGLLATQAQHTSLTEQRLTSYSWGERFLFACYGIIQYLKQLLAPIKLSNFYTYPVKSDGTFPIIVYLSPLIVMGLLFLVFRFRKNRSLVFGSLYFLSTIFIVLQLLPVGDAITADRYTYIPYIGLFFVASQSLNTLLEHKARRKMILYGLGGYLLVLTFLTYERTKDWRNSEVLWTDVIEKYPETAIAYNNRGAVRDEAKRADEAMVDFQLAIRYKPDYFEAYNNLAGAYGQKGMQKEEMATYDKTIAIQPGYTTAYFNRGLSYVKYGQNELALRDYDVVRKAEPQNPKVYYSIGIAYKNLGRADLAIENYSKAIRIDPYYIDAYNNRANIYFNAQKYDDAIRDYNRALQVQPDSTWSC